MWWPGTTGGLSLFLSLTHRISKALHVGGFLVTDQNLNLGWLGFGYTITKRSTQREIRGFLLSDRFVIYQMKCVHFSDVVVVVVVGRRCFTDTARTYLTPTHLYVLYPWTHLYVLYPCSMINLEEETLFCSTATLRLRLVHELTAIHKKQLRFTSQSFAEELAMHKKHHHFTSQSFAEELQLKWTPTG